MGENLQPSINAFAGRLGGNQKFIVDRDDPKNAALLEQTPDAAPMIPLQQLFSPRGFRNLTLWKQAVAEGLGTFLLVYITTYMAVSPNIPPPPFDPILGPFSSPAFIGGCAGVIMAAVVFTVSILVFGPITGGHLNPFITIATLFVRLTTLPRAILYVSFQTAGASLAGLMLRASWGGRDFKVAGCFMFEAEGVTVGTAFAIEYTVGLALIIIAFGVGFDPRNRDILGAILGPLFLGLLVGVLNLGFGFPKQGYGGPSLHPGRCFGAYVGSRFPGYHWIHWVGPICASATHAVMYYALPPWTFQDELKQLKEEENQASLTASREKSATGVMKRTNFQKSREGRDDAQSLGV